MGPTDSDESPVRRTISRRALIIGSVGAVSVGAVAYVAVRSVPGTHRDATAPTEESDTAASDSSASGPRPKVEYAHDVPRVPLDPSTGVAGWPVDPAGAQLVQAPV